MGTGGPCSGIIGNMSRTSARRAVKKKARNLLDMLPVRNPKYHFTNYSQESQEINADTADAVSAILPSSTQTFISIAVPRFKGKVGTGIIKAFGIKPNINVNLDACGSFIFRRLDGKKSVREIGEELRAEFGDKMEPLYQRLSDFLSILEKNKLIYFLPKEFDRKQRNSK